MVLLVLYAMKYMALVWPIPETKDQVKFYTPPTIGIEAAAATKHGIEQIEYVECDVGNVKIHLPPTKQKWWDL